MQIRACAAGAGRRLVAGRVARNVVGQRPADRPAGRCEFSRAGRGSRDPRFWPAATGRNLNVVILVLVLLAGNVAFHLEAHWRGWPRSSIRIGIAVVVLLISLIGGCIIPSLPATGWCGRSRPASDAVRPLRHNRRRHHRADAGGLGRQFREPAHRRRAGSCRFAAPGAALAALGRRPYLPRAALADPACRLPVRAARLSAHYRLRVRSSAARAPVFMPGWRGPPASWRWR